MQVWGAAGDYSDWMFGSGSHTGDAPFGNNMTGLEKVSSDAKSYYAATASFTNPDDTYTVATAPNHPTDATAFAVESSGSSIRTISGGGGGGGEGARPRRVGFGMLDYSDATQAFRATLLGAVAWACRVPGPLPPIPPPPKPTTEQLHIAFGAEPGSILVQWASKTTDASMAGQLWYGSPTVPTEQWGAVPVESTASGPGPYTQYRVTLRKLIPEQQYGYAVGWKGDAVTDAATTISKFWAPADEAALDWYGQECNVSTLMRHSDES